MKALVEPSSDGAPSPYTVRILTRNPDHPKVKAEFNHPNVELVQGSFTDLARVERALKGVWGAYINTDGFTVGEQAETYYGLRIFELAACVPTLKHYVWSNLDYGLKKGGYRPEYHCGHYVLAPLRRWLMLCSGYARLVRTSSRVWRSRSMADLKPAPPCFWRHELRILSPDPPSL